MRNDALIRESLLYKNRDNHEQSDLIECAAGKAIPGAKWGDINSALTSGEAKLPINLDDNGNALFTDFTHATINGSTGTGKSEVIVKNMLEIFSRMPDDKKPSFLASDLKGDISRELGGHLEESGYDVIIMDMKRPYQSNRYNFMTQIYDDYHEAYKIEKMLKADQITTSFGGKRYRTRDEARAAANARMLTLNDSVEHAINDLTNIIIVCTDEKDAIWFQGARTMLAAVIFTLLFDSRKENSGMTREKFTIANVCRTAFTTEEDCETIIEWLKRHEDNLTVQNAIMGNYDLRAKVTRDGYVSTLNTCLSSYVGNGIYALTATGDDIDLRQQHRYDAYQQPCFRAYKICGQQRSENSSERLRIPS